MANAEARNAAQSIQTKCADSFKTVRDHSKREWLSVLSSGFTAVAHSRTTISYGYVRLHGLRKFPIAKELFRFGLSDLELRTDDLQESLEKLATDHIRAPDKLLASRVDAEALTRLVDSFVSSFSSGDLGSRGDANAPEEAEAIESDEAKAKRLAPFKEAFPSKTRFETLIGLPSGMPMHLFVFAALTCSPKFSFFLFVISTRFILGVYVRVGSSSTASTTTTTATTGRAAAAPAMFGATNNQQFGGFGMSASCPAHGSSTMSRTGGLFGSGPFVCSECAYSTDR